MLNPLDGPPSLGRRVLDGRQFRVGVAVCQDVQAIAIPAVLDDPVFVRGHDNRAVRRADALDLDQAQLTIAAGPTDQARSSSLRPNASGPKANEPAAPGCGLISRSL